MKLNKYDSLLEILNNIKPRFVYNNKFGFFGFCFI